MTSEICWRCSNGIHEECKKWWIEQEPSGRLIIADCSCCPDQPNNESGRQGLMEEELRAIKVFMKNRIDFDGDCTVWEKYLECREQIISRLEEWER